MTADDALGRRGGRPTARAAAALETVILDEATAAFLRDGYDATSIQAIARACRVAKRTIYARWPDGKPGLFHAVTERLMARWLSESGAWPETDDLATALHAAAVRILAVALKPEAVALHRLLLAESGRFPELPLMLHQAGAAEGTSRIAALLRRAAETGKLPPQDMAFAAEQFMHLVLAGPQRRALGLGRQLDGAELAAWARAAVALFLSGVRGSPA
jgi:TetR/AcrR family transcriptional regulator, mexJK operon transcriptional repressor